MSYSDAENVLWVFPEIWAPVESDCGPKMANMFRRSNLSRVRRSLTAVMIASMTMV